MRFFVAVIEWLRERLGARGSRRPAVLAAVVGLSFASILGITATALAVGGAVAPPSASPAPTASLATSTPDSGAGELSDGGPTLGAEPQGPAAYGAVPKGYAPVNEAVGIAGLTYRWVGETIDLLWTGACDQGPVQVWLLPQNNGYLQRPIAGIQGLGGGSGTDICQSAGRGRHMSMSATLSYWKCFNFTEAWVRVEGTAPGAGLYRIPMPASITAANCPPGAADNDPHYVWNVSLEQGLVPDFAGEPYYLPGDSRSPEPTVTLPPEPSPTATPAPTVAPTPDSTPAGTP